MTQIGVFPEDIWRLLINFMNLGTVMILKGVSKILEEVIRKHKQIYINYGSNDFIIDCKSSGLISVKDEYKQVDNPDYGLLYDVISTKNKIIVYDQPPCAEYSQQYHPGLGFIGDLNFETEIINLQKRCTIRTRDEIIFIFKNEGHMCKFYCKPGEWNHIVDHWEFS